MFSLKAYIFIPFHLFHVTSDFLTVQLFILFLLCWFNFNIRSIYIFWPDFSLSKSPLVFTSGQLGLTYHYSWLNCSLLNNSKISQSNFTIILSGNRHSIPCSISHRFWQNGQVTVSLQLKWLKFYLELKRTQGNVFCKTFIQCFCFIFKINSCIHWHTE